MDSGQLEIDQLIAHRDRVDSDTSLHFDSVDSDQEEMDSVEELKMVVANQELQLARLQHQHSSFETRLNKI